MLYDKLEKLIAQYFSNDNISRYLYESRSRVEYTIDALQPLDLRGKKVCEIGFGAIGLGIYLGFKADVDAYDVSNMFSRICEDFGITHTIVDLNSPEGIHLNRTYDLIILCEVIEHLNRWPVSVLLDLYKYLEPGGKLLITTPNLLRLTNRIRMLTGKRLFAHFIQEHLIMGHLREYTQDELDFLLRQAGFTNIRVELHNFPDRNRSKMEQVCYNKITKLFPLLSNYIICWSEKPFLVK